MIQNLIYKIKNDYDYKTFILAGISSIICFGYSLYNGILGVICNSLWNGSICIYYLLLLIFKFLLIFFEKKLTKINKNKLIIFSYIFLLIIALAMITPVILLIENKRDYNLGLIPSIAMAAYTTFSLIMALINIKKSKQSKNELVKIIRLINTISVLMSIIVLQNTLILVNGGYSRTMEVVTIITSCVVIAIIFLIIALSFYKYIKRKNIKYN